MALLCFDVDGTLVPGIGPIPVDVLHELEGVGHKVVIVSPSPLRPPDAPFPEFLSVDFYAPRSAADVLLPVSEKKHTKC